MLEPDLGDGSHQLLSKMEIFETRSMKVRSFLRLGLGLLAFLGWLLVLSWLLSIFVLRRVVDHFLVDVCHCVYKI